jgi:excisionase family DNA binding protein
MLNQNERLISVHWVARRLGFSERTIREWARTGVLPAVRSGRKIWLFESGAIDRFKLSHHARRPRQRGTGLTSRSHI